MKAAPRVLHSAIVLDQPMGGVQRQATELLPRLARKLAENGGGLDLLLPRDGLPKELTERLPETCRLIPSNVDSGPLSRASTEGFALRRAIRDHGPYDLWHTGHLPAPHGTGLPFTVQIHDLRNLSQLAAFPKRFAARATLKSAFLRAAAVLTVSEAVAVEVRHQFKGVQPIAIHHGADHLPVLPRRADANARVLFFGHLEKRRNPELLLRALAEERTLPDVHFVGRPKGDYAEHLAALAHKWGVANRIEIRGPVPESELPTLFACAACLVIPSLVEGFGIPAVEALRARLPLAVADTPALREATPDTTPTFDPADPAACAAAITAALSQPAATLEAAHAFANRYSWNHTAAKWLRVWQDVAEGRA